jgi:hypothetical protein
VERLRQSGVAIGAHPEAGYYWPACMEDVERACRFMDSRAFKSLGQTRKMRRWAKREFGPQLKLDLFEEAR